MSSLLDISEVVHWFQLGRIKKQNFTFSAQKRSKYRQDLSGPCDHSYFDSYPPDDSSAQEELSGWDADF
ncbi:hypothetical protein CRUP_007508 [Coryphaenoides rupestris]|nr:hypothetical protein CRUP_007508 [Coryphaenoides rupestris]